MTDHIHCPYCPDTPVAHNLLKHIFSKHEKAFFHKRNIDLLHQHGHIISKTCPPFFYMNGNGTQEYFCCFGCMKAVKKEPFAVRHFPKCFEEHKTKLLSLMAKYPLAPLAPAIVANTVVQNQVVNVTNNTTVNVKFGDKMSLALSAAMYTCYKEEAKIASRATIKLQKVMEKFLKEIKPLATTQEGRNIMERFHDFLDEGYESTDSTASSVGEDPNDIKKEVEKEHEVKLPNIIKTKETDDFGDKKYIFKV